MFKHIGIVGCSYEGTALCYRTICSESQNQMGEFNHPEITIHTPPLSKYMELIKVGNWQGVAEIILSSANILKNAGADFIICPDNTIHEAYELMIDESPLPWIHIVEPVVTEAKRQNFSNLALLGTRYLMTGPVYPNILEEHNIKYRLPDEDSQEHINHIIFSELGNGIFTEKSRHYFNNVIQELKNCGCDAAILGCTEIPLLIDKNSCPLPTLDSTRLLAKAAVKKSILTQNS